MDVFDIFATLSLDTSGYQQNLNEAESSGAGFGKGLAKAAGVVAAGVTAASAAVGKLTQSAVSAYGEYQQLEGGIETLYGDAASTMMGYAEQAFTTTGQSMNDYMDTAIATSAAMISSLEGDTATAADLVNLSMIDMADNVNKMGTSMESIENAYRGFSRQNFTMLDNLALGYAGTKSGMEELLADAQAISGVEYDISSYSDIVQAIHVIQENMGIAGTTSLEAGETITGSLASVRAAWDNLVLGMADPDADLGALIDSFVQQGTTALSNLMPTIERALAGVGEFVEDIAPVIADTLPSLIADTLPSLISAAMSLIEGLVSALPTLLDTAMQSVLLILTELMEGDALTTLLDTILEVMLMLMNFIAENADTIVQAVVQIVTTIALWLTDAGNISLLVNAVFEIVTALTVALAEALPQILVAIVELLANIVDNFLQFRDDSVNGVTDLILQIVLAFGQMGAEILLAFADLITDGLSYFDELSGGMLSRAVNLVTNIPDLFRQMWSAAIGVFAEGSTGIVTWVANIGTSIANGFMSLVTSARTWATDMIDNFIGGITAGISRVAEAAGNIASTVRNYIGFSEPEEGALSDFHTYAPDMIDLFTSGLTAGRGQIADAMNSLFAMPVNDLSLGLSGAAVGGAATAGYSMQSAEPQVIQVYIGQEKLDEIMVQSAQRTNFISGGRA